MDVLQKPQTTFDSSVFRALKVAVETAYTAFDKVRCPYLQEDVSFNAKGLEHLKFKKKNHARSQADQFTRLKLLRYVPEVIRLSRTLQGLKKTRLFERFRTNQRNEDVLVDVIFYEFISIVDERVRIRVVVKRVGEAPPYFWSVIPFWKGFSENGDRVMHYGNPIND